MMSRNSRPRRQHKSQPVKPGDASSPQLPAHTAPSTSSKPSNTEALMRRASELLGPSLASIYVAIFKVVTYCRYDPIPCIVDIAKSLLGYDTPTLSATPLTVTNRSGAASERVFREHQTLLNKLYSWSCNELMTQPLQEHSPLADMMSKRSLAFATHARVMLSGMRRATTLAATMIENPRSLLKAAACLAVAVPELQHSGSYTSMTSPLMKPSSSGALSAQSPSTNAMVIPFPLQHPSSEVFGPAASPTGVPAMPWLPPAHVTGTGATSPAFEIGDPDDGPSPSPQVSPVAHVCSKLRNGPSLLHTMLVASCEFYHHTFMFSCVCLCLCVHFDRKCLVFVQVAACMLC